MIAPWAPAFHSSGSILDWQTSLGDKSRIKVHRTPGTLSQELPFFALWLGRALSLIEKLTKREKGALRKYMHFPDECVSWLLFAVPWAFWVALTKRPQVVVTSSYPYSAHIAGSLVERFFRCSWIMDMRDGWAVDDTEQFPLIEPSPKLRKRHRMLMSSMVKRARQVWSITPDIRAATARFFENELSPKFVSVIQGYDMQWIIPEADNAEDAVQRNQSNCEFVIGYAGSFRPDVTPIEPLAEALRILKQKNYVIYSRARVRVWGYPNRKDYYDYLIREMNVRAVLDRLDHRDSIPEKQLVDELRRCDLLLLTNGSANWSQKRLTTKLFVYLAANRPIFAICEPTSAVARFISEARVGLLLPIRNPVSVAAVLGDLIGIQSKGGRPLAYKPNVDVVRSYSLQEGVIPLIGKQIEQATSR